MRAWRAAVVAVLALLGAASPAAAGSGRIRVEEGWVRDGRGRVLLLRGMNYSGLEFGNVIGRPRGPEEADFAQMERWGVTVVRVPIAWHYLEPAPGVLDEEHLRTQVDPIVEWARRRDIAVVLEAHQFFWSPCTGGNGAPAWSCEGKGYSRDFPGALAAQHDFWAGAAAPDGRPLVDHFLDVWGMIVQRYRRSRTVIGFDFLNEPIDAFALATFERDRLYPFYRRAVALVRALGAPQIVVLEPPVSRNLGIGANPEPVGDDNLLWAPHLYTTTFGLDTLAYTGDRAAVDADYALAADEARRQGAVLWPGEHGGVVDRFPAETTLFYHHTLDEQDERLVGGAAWAYFPSDNGFSVVDAAGNEKAGVVDALVRPYPVQTAGIPQAFRWDRATGLLTYGFAEDPARRIPDPTILFVPLRHYPTGVTVETSPGDRAVHDPARQRVVVRRDPSQPLHTVTIRPRG